MPVGNTAAIKPLVSATVSLIDVPLKWNFHLSGFHCTSERFCPRSNQVLLSCSPPGSASALRGAWPASRCSRRAGWTTRKGTSWTSWTDKLEKEKKITSHLWQSAVDFQEKKSRPLLLPDASSPPPPPPPPLPVVTAAPASANDEIATRSNTAKKMS